MSASQRRKGACGEREAAELLRAVYPLADRNPMQSRGAGRDGCDVEGTPWWCEVKSHAKPAPLAALRQAWKDANEAEDARPALVLAKTTRAGWTVTLSWGDFERLVSEGQRARAAAVQVATPGAAGCARCDGTGGWAPRPNAALADCDDCDGTGKAPGAVKPRASKGAASALTSAGRRQREGA